MRLQVYPLQPGWAAPGLRLNDWLFSEPAPLREWFPPGCPGILAVLNRDSNWSPKPFRPLYFGEFGNDAGNSSAGPPMTAPHAGGDLYVAVLPMPFSTTSQRRAVRNELVSAYNPICQAGVNLSSDEMLQRLEQLESRQVEQSAQILAVLGRIVKLFEPQPVAPRRAIGFQPRAAPAGAAGLTESGT